MSSAVVKVTVPGSVKSPERTTLKVTVFGVADATLGQRVVAAVVAADGYAPPTLSELRTHVKATLDPTAAPREVHIVDELPRRGIGKVDRRRLVALFTH